MGNQATNRRERLLDELLVLSARDGNRRAFERLAERWQERLWRHAYRLTGREEVAWDILQDTWVHVVRDLASLHDVAAFRSWIYIIVTRKVTDRLRRSGFESSATTETLDAHPSERAEDESDRTQREEAIDDLRGALRRLPPDQRSLLYMHYVEQFTMAEIATIHGIPEGTVKSRLHHARQHIKEILERTES